MTPSSLNVTVEQGVAVFHCQHESSDDITWRLNGKAVSSPNITIERVPLGSGGFYSSLLIPTLLDFNQTTIECVAVFYQETDPFQFCTISDSTNSRYVNQNLMLVQECLCNSHCPF